MSYPRRVILQVQYKQLCAKVAKLGLRYNVTLGLWCLIVAVEAMRMLSRKGTLEKIFTRELGTTSFSDDRKTKK
jgi:hypothetical protein